MRAFATSKLLLFALLCLSAAAQAERYTIPWFVNAGVGGAPQGVLRILNGTDESGSVEIVAIDATGARTGPVTLGLNPWVAVEFTASELESGNAAKGLPSGLGSLAGDVRLLIDSDVEIVPSAFVRSGDGALAAVHDTVLESRDAGVDTYRYDAAIFHPAANAAQQSRLRLINPGGTAARIAIAARDDAGMAATGGTVELTLPGGAARTLTARQFEAGDPAALTGRLGAGTGNWRLSVTSDRPIQAVNVTVGSGGDWSNLSTTAVTGWAPEDQASFEARFLDRVIVSRDGLDRLELRVLAGNRFRDTGLEDGVRTSEEGEYGFERTGRDSGLLTLMPDSGQPCAANFYFDSPISGWYASGCVDSADAAENWTGGGWRALDAGAAPLDLGAGLEDLAYAAGAAINAVTLPAASGGDGRFTYSLSPEVPGLSFDPATRELSGTPSEDGAWLMTYRVRDASGDSDWRYFSIEVQAATGQETSHEVGDTLSDLPTGSWTPNLSGEGSVRTSGGVVTAELDDGTYFEHAGHRYTCQSAGGCRIENRRITSGSVVQTASGTAPGGSVPGDPGDDRASAAEVAAVSDTEADLTAGDVDYFRVVLDAPGTLEAYTSGRTDTLGRLEDADGAVLGRNDDGGAGTNFRISEDVSAGTHYVRVAGYSSRVTGDYTLHVRFTGSGTDDRAALMALYNATDGPNWAINDNWGSDVPLERWHGVATDDNGRVTSIDLRENQLHGPIPAELGNLSSLVWLLLNDNQLSGPIPPELGNLSNLESLFLYSNQLSGPIPAELGNLSSLVQLLLSINQLSGAIPIELGNLSNLYWVNLNSNQLSGPIPAELGNLSNLSRLFLHDNQLSGSIPAELGNLTNLAYLYLFDNQLSGSIPAELGNLSKLVDLLLFGNQLSGPIPGELGNLSNLAKLELAGNQLSGCIPDGLRDVATNDLSTLDLAYCGDSGTPGGGQETTFGAGDTLSDLPAGAWVPNISGGGSVLNLGGVVTVGLNDGSYFEHGGHRYTCQGSDGCVIENRRVTSGTVVQTASGTAPGSGARDAQPSFPIGSSPDNQTYTVGTAIAALTLPEATGGDGPLTYSLTPAVPGLAFNATATVRRLTGTPTEAGTYDMTYRVRDTDGDTDSLSFIITVENAGGGGSEAADFDLDSANGDAEGIVFANGRFHVVDSTDGNVYAYTASGRRDASADFDLDSANGDAVGIAFANGRFHVVDERDDKVYAYTASGQRDASADFDLDSANGNPWGIAFANGWFHIVDLWANTKVYGYTASGQRDAAADFDLDYYNSYPRGIVFANGQFYIVDSLFEKVHAYAAGHGVAAFDFDLDRDNSHPKGIAFANGRFYVVDWSDDKVYAYTASGERVSGGGSSDGMPDLAVQSASVSDSAPSVGGSFTLSATVRNDGDGDAPATTLRYYRSSNATISRSDTQVGTDSVSGLSASRTSAESIRLTAPSTAGTYYYGACVDSVTGESDTDNNCSSGVRVTVSGGGDPGGGGDGSCVEVNDVIELGEGESCTITQALVNKYRLNNLGVQTGDSASCSGGRVRLGLISGSGSIYLLGLTIRCG